MWLAILTAVVAVGLGSAVGLLRDRTERYTGPAQTFALVSVLTVVCARMVPDALARIGPWALAAFVLGFLAPGWLERLAARVQSRAPEGSVGLGLELGYLGLLAHQLGDGLVLGVYSGALHGGHVHADVLLAVGAHNVPVAALIVLAYRRRAGLGTAMTRAAGLALVMLLGIGVALVTPLERVGRVEPWVTAVVAGLLLHVVVHGFHEKPLTNAPRRLFDIVAVALGAAVVLVIGDHPHGDDHPGAYGLPVGAAFLELTLETAPLLLFGLAVGALLQLFGSRIPGRWLSGGGDLGQAVRGAMIGAPLPVCACGVLPIAQSLRQRGAGTAFVVAFLLSTPELGVETFALTIRFLGWQFAWVRLLAAVGLAIVAGVLVAHTARSNVGPAGEAHGDDCCVPEVGPIAPGAALASLPARLLGHFDDLLQHVGPWTVVGLIAAAYLQAGLDRDALVSLAGSGLDIPVVMLVAVPSYVCASSATPFAAVLLAKGLSPGAVLAGLLLGPATNLATLGWLRRSFGSRAAVVGIAGIVVTCWLLASALNAAPPDISTAVAGTSDHEHGAIAYGAAALLALLLLRGIWRTGLRAWLGSLGESLGTAHTHAHGHEHAHEHEHSGPHPHKHDHSDEAAVS